LPGVIQGNLVDARVDVARLVRDGGVVHPNSSDIVMETGAVLSGSAVSADPRAGSPSGPEQYDPG
jgi:hypothetical protein